jgi:hypothetical protein
MHVVPEPANILAALMCALEQPHTITERGGELFIVPPPGGDKISYRRRSRTSARSARCARCGGSPAVRTGH